MSSLPSVERLAEDARCSLAPGEPAPPGPVLMEAARRALAAHRDLVGGASPTADRPERTGSAGQDLLARTLLEVRRSRPTGRVLNATGVLLHTNLGRAPCTEAGSVVGAGYADVEFDLASGLRGPRFPGLEAAVRALTGAEAALVVNNNAAGVLLALSTVSAGTEVVVSRGELVEIGGSFRIPEVVTQGGAVLREVGTTNRTHRSDYRDAIGERTGAILSVHRSNYVISGFTSRVAHRDLVDLARSGGVPLLVDLGGGLPDSRCGWLPDGPPPWLADEPGVRQCVSAGANLVMFSGDKLLGGPQAGLVVGDAALVERMRRHPLARALRIDKHRASLLHEVVSAYLDRSAATRVPLWSMVAVPQAELLQRAEAIVRDVRSTLARQGADSGDLDIAAEPMTGTVGAGAAPGSEVPGAGIRLVPRHCGPDELARRLRVHPSRVVSVVGEGAVRLHLRTIDRSDDPALAGAVAAVA